MAAATSDLEHLQALLRRATQGRAGVGEVTEGVGNFWRDHGAALSTGAAALGEQARGQLLAELYRMRDQLARQRGAGAPTPPPGQDAGAPEGHDRGS